MKPVSNHNKLGNTTQIDDKQLKSSHVLNNFKKLVLTVAVKSSKNKSLVGSQTVILEKHLDELLPLLSTRHDHIPYSAMIEKALRQLDGQRGSSKEAISNFIKKTYGDLPYFHDELLKHHLVELYKKGDIAQTNDGSYFSNNSRSKRIPIISSLSKMSISKPKNSSGFDESIVGSSSNPCNDKRPTMEASMEAKRKGKGKEKLVIGTTTRSSNMEAKRKGNGYVVRPVGRRTRSSIKRIGI